MRKDYGIASIVELDGKLYFQVNREGTLVSMGSPGFRCRFWLEFRDCFKKWEMNEAIEFIKHCEKRKKRLDKRRNKDA